MLRKILFPLTLSLGAFLFISCSEESNPKFDTQSFTHIYDNANFEAIYLPVDIVQTADGGYLVLSAQPDSTTGYSSIHLLKVDKFGNYVNELAGDATFKNPVGRLTQVGDSYYFFCMDFPFLLTHLASVDVNLTAITTTPLSQDLRYPAVSAYNATDGFILQSYNDDAQETVISTVSTAGAVQKSKGYNIGVGDDVLDEKIINHFITSGRKIPFEVGKLSSGQYFMTGFYNYTFSLLFTDIASDEPSGIVNGSGDDAGFSAVTPVSGTKFAASSFSFGANFFFPNKTINLSGDEIDYATGLSLVELVPNAKVKILRATINERNVIIYASDTKSKQIGLFFYDEATGEFLSSRYLGFTNPFEIANLISTSDGGLAVCGTTYLAGRFPRVCIFKLSEKEITSNVK